MKNFYLLMLLAVSFISTKKIQAQTTIYNSYPSAQAVILLDFDGHNVTGTAWNWSGPINAASANLTSAQIAEIVSRVAEDYRPFNINVTTDESKYTAAPNNRRMRVIFTTTSSWYGSSAGGVAITNSFTSGDNTPCFVFTALLNYNTKYIAEAGSHEAGHTFGLTHQASYDASCVKRSDYHTGTGSGETAWAPIMGVGYYRNFTVWHNGPTGSGGCNSSQNDLAIITNSTNGIGYRVDDHATSTREATTATFNSNIFNVNGVISQTDDADMFKFSVAQTGRFTLSGVPYNVGVGNVGSNLDMQLDLYNNKNDLIGSYNPGTELGSIVDTLLNAGTYYFKVDGQGNMYASEYGSMGSYSLQGNFTPQTVLPLHKLEIKGLSENGKHKLNWEIEADETVIAQVLEIADNGGIFKPLAEVASHLRTYQYAHSNTGTLQYRVRVSFDDGKHYYSNVISLKTAGKEQKPQIFNSMVRNNALLVSSPVACQFSIMDYNGRQLMTGTISKGSSSINISQLQTGAFIIRLVYGSEQNVEKFVKH
jgi:hypothetical protein